MISICMAYYNRKPQLLKTLDSLNESSVKDFELVIVDDGSSPEHKLDVEEMHKHCHCNINLIEIDKEKKNWYGSCVAYNAAFSAAVGDKIIIQNPETYHMGDLLSAFDTSIKDGEYYSVHTIALNEIDSSGMYTRNSISDIAVYMQPILYRTHHLKPEESCPYDGHTIWYNHKLYRPVHYHFITGITKNDLNKLGGFDERYKDDHSWDDDEFLLRINRLGLRKIFIESPIAIHQYHEYLYFNSPHNGQKNVQLFNNVSLKENKILAQELNFNNYRQYLK